MDEITLSNSTRILRFLQQFRMDFNEYSIWNYSRKKFHFNESNRPLITESMDFLQEQGCIERVRRPGYYKLTDKGKNFISWDLEKIQVTKQEETPEPKSWRQWFGLGSLQSDRA